MSCPSQCRVSAVSCPCLVDWGQSPPASGVCVLGEEGVEVTGSSLLCASIWDAEAIFLAAPDSLLAGIWCWGVYCCKDVPRIPGSLRNLLCRRALTQCCSVTFLCCFCTGKRRNGSLCSRLLLALEGQLLWFSEKPCHREWQQLWVWLNCGLLGEAALRFLHKCYSTFLSEQ